MGKKSKKGATRAGATEAAGSPPSDGALNGIALAVDVVAVTQRQGELAVLLVKASPPGVAGEWALPSCRIGAEEPLEAAARRALDAAAGADLGPSYLEQVRAYDTPAGDGRSGPRTVSLAYVAIVPAAAEIDDASGADAADWRLARSVFSGSVRLAAHQATIVRDALARLQSELEHTAVATAFFRNAFTEAQLRSVYEIVWGAGQATGRLAIDAPNFHRSIASLSPPLLEQLPDERAATGGRPAALYRPSDSVREGGPASCLERPILRPKSGPAKRKVH